LSSHTSPLSYSLSLFGGILFCSSNGVVLSRIRELAIYVAFLVPFPRDAISRALT